MEIKKCNLTVTCDMEGCNNLANYSFRMKRLFSRQTFICKNCMNEMQKLFNEVSPPKSPNNMLNHKGVKNEKSK